MIFKESLKDKTVNKDENIKSLSILLEPEREYKLKRIRIAYTDKVKPVSKSKLIKTAIDNLIKDVEEQDSEEEALEYIRRLYKEAEF